MARSTKKGAFVDAYLQTRVEGMNARNEKKVLRSFTRTFKGHSMRAATETAAKPAGIPGGPGAITPSAPAAPAAPKA